MESNQEKVVAAVLIAIVLLVSATASAAPATNVTKARMDMCAAYRTRVTMFIAYHNDLIKQSTNLHSLVVYPQTVSSPDYPRILFWYESTIAVRDAYYSFILRENALFSSTCGVLK